MKKYTILLGTMFLLFTSAMAQNNNNVGIGTDSPHASAVLDVSSNDKGILIPRMTQANRNAIANPANGLMVYQTDETEGFYYYTNNQWKSLSGNAGGGVPQTGIVHSETQENANLINGGFSLIGRSQISVETLRGETEESVWKTAAQMPTTNKASHTIIWTGSEAIVCGGIITGSTSINQFSDQSIFAPEAYNPVTNSWRTISSGLLTNSNDDARRNHSALWTGTEMIIWGGRLRAGGCQAVFSVYGYGCVNGTHWSKDKYLNNGYRYNPVTGLWIEFTNAPIAAREFHTSVWTGTEMIIWGGNNGSSRFNDGAKYNPSTNQWTMINSSGAPSNRTNHTSVWTGTEMIIWGGVNGSSVFNDGAKYNPSTDQWSTLSSNQVPSARSNHIAVWIGTEMVVWGGAASGTPTNTGGRYNPNTNVWQATSTNNAPQAVQNHVGVWANGRLVVWGGKKSTANSYSNEGGIYDPVNDTWESLVTTAGLVASENSKAVWTGSDVIITGGAQGSTIPLYGQCSTLKPKGAIGFNEDVSKYLYLFKKN